MQTEETQRAPAQVLAGPPAQLVLSSHPECDRLAVTNGEEAMSRLLLAGAALQLQDEYGNPCHAHGQRVRISLQWPAGEEGVRQHVISDLSPLQCCQLFVSWTHSRLPLLR